MGVAAFPRPRKLAQMFPEIWPASTGSSRVPGNSLQRTGEISRAKRMVIPTVRDVLTFPEALSYAQAAGRDLSMPEQPVLLIPYEHASGMEKTRELLSQIRTGQPVAVLIGPEGGFEETEVQAAQEAGFRTITLGKRILRTETAGMTVLSVLMYLLEEN